MKKLFTILVSLALVMSAAAQTVRVPGGGIRTTNSPFTGAVMTTDGTNFYWTDGSSISARAGNGTLSRDTTQVITATNFTKLYTNWAVASGSGVVTDISGTNGSVRVTNDGYYIIGTAVNYRYNTNINIPRTNYFYATTNLGGVGTNLTFIGAATIANGSTNYISSASMASVYLPSNTYVALGFYSFGQLATNDIAIENARLFVSTVAGGGGTVSSSGGDSTNLLTGRQYWVDPAHISASDANAGTNFAAPLATLTGAVAKATSGSTIRLRPNTYALGTNHVSIPHGVSLIGEDPINTIITGTGDLTTNGVIVNPGSDSIIANLTIVPTNMAAVFQGAIGVRWNALVAGQKSFTNTIFRNLRLVGDTDVIYLNNSNKLTLRIENCWADSAWDNLTMFNIDSNKVVDVVDSTFIADLSGALHPTSISSAQATPVRNYGGWLRMHGCTIIATNANTTYGFSVPGGGLWNRTDFYDCQFLVAGTNTAAKIENSSSGIINVFGNTYDVANVTPAGSVTFRDRNSGSTNFIYGAAGMRIWDEDQFNSKVGVTGAGVFYVDGVTRIGGVATMQAGTGTPEGSISADLGSIYLRTNAAGGVNLYVKTNGAGNTGWWGVVGSGSSATNYSAGNTNVTSYAIVQNGTNNTGAIKTLTAGANITITENGSTNLTFTASGGAASTNNPVQEIGRVSVTNNYVNVLKAAFQGGPTPASTNYLYATNGDSQFYNLTRHTNIVFVPLSGADATNSPGISALFKQDATGGFFPTNNGQVITIATNPLAETWVLFSISGGGATNVTPNDPRTFSPPSNLDVVEWNTASGKWTNVTSSGSGSVARTNAPTLFTPTINTITNVTAQSWNYMTMLLATNSTLTNFVLNFGNTNVLDVYTTNWWMQWTNISGLSSGKLATKTVRITPSAPGQNLTNIWPAGSQHGLYRFMTNANSPFWTVLTNAKTYVVDITAIDTNLHGTITLWE